MNSILILGYLGTQTPVHDHLTLSRICTVVYFGYYFSLPVLNFIDLYFFENKPKIAMDHYNEFKKSLPFVLVMLVNIIEQTVINLYT